MKKRRWLRILNLLLLVYLLIGVGLYYLQDAILFHPVRLNRSASYRFSAPHRDISIPMEENSQMNIIQFLTKEEAKGVVLYFHGNKKNIGWYAKYAPYFTKEGYEVWMIDYPGFGKSTGELTEEKLYDFANALYKLARQRFNKNQIILYGKSMGTGIAAYVAAKRDAQQLILETPYYDIPSLIQFYLPIYPVHNLLHYRLPTHEYLARTEIPVTIFQGTSDWIVPYKNAQLLIPYLKKTDKFVTVSSANHNNLFQFTIVKETLHQQLQ